eukprot:scaffold1137_cov392-Pavlova_lutheri.AAC.20
MSLKMIDTSGIRHTQKGKSVQWNNATTKWLNMRVRCFRPNQAPALARHDVGDERWYANPYLKYIGGMVGQSAFPSSLLGTPDRP